jgi:hypothetical protein
MYMTMKADVQVNMKYTMKTCHRSYAYPSWKRPYMEMTWLARIDVIDAVPKSQPRKFHLFHKVSQHPPGGMYEARDLPTSKETQGFAIFGSCCDARPVIYARRGWYGRSHFGDTSRNHEVET